jgi:flavin reductase (DIM6/NTAB) family NADH-FMN oxidoreductase RutF
MYVEGDDFGSRDFRRSVWHQTTTAVALLTCAAGERVDVMACEWAMLVSISPFCFVVAVHASHATHALIAESGEFGLSFCSDQQARLSHVSGSYSMHDVDKWALEKFPTRPGRKISAPMIDGSVLNAECRVVATHELGHTLYIGETSWARFDPEKDPLLYHDGKYWRMGEQVPKS